MGRKCYTETYETRVWNIATQSKMQVSTKRALGERIRFYRQKAQLQQDELAEKLGITCKAVSRWEVGGARPDLDNLLPLCNALNITPAQLLGYDQPDLSVKEWDLLRKYRHLSELDQHSIDTLVSNLTRAHEMREREKVHLVEIRAAYHPLVAGIGLSEEWSANCETIFLHDSPLARRADYVFTVSGDSMEPTYHSGDRVFVEEINPSTMLPGTIGAFQYDNSTYIKEYTENGLLSHNPKYKLMEFDENTEVLLIGKVIGTLSAEDIPTAEEIEMFRSLRND